MKNNGKSASQAFTLLELLVVLAILAVLASLLPPALAQSKQKSARLTCANNLKQVGTAFRVWAGNHQDRYPMQVGSVLGGPFNQTQIIGPAGAIFTYQIFQVMSNELNSTRTVVCPADDRLIGYSFRNGDAVANPLIAYANANLSYFVGRDANETNPQMFLAGDRNLGQGGVPNTTPTTALVNQTVGLGTNTLTMNQRNVGWTDRLHTKAGNVGLADGSVEQFTNSRFRESAGQTGDRGSGQPSQVVISPGGNVLLVP